MAMARFSAPGNWRCSCPPIWSAKTAARRFGKENHHRDKVLRRVIAPSHPQGIVAAHCSV